MGQIIFVSSHTEASKHMLQQLDTFVQECWKSICTHGKRRRTDRKRQLLPLDYTEDTWIQASFFSCNYSTGHDIQAHLEQS